MHTVPFLILCKFYRVNFEEYFLKYFSIDFLIRYTGFNKYVFSVQSELLFSSKLTCSMVNL